jgi:hypothetical protein
MAIIGGSGQSNKGIIKADNASQYNIELCMIPFFSERVEQSVNQSLNSAEYPHLPAPAAPTRSNGMDREDSGSSEIFE